MGGDHVEAVDESNGGSQHKSMLLTGELEEAINHLITLGIPFQERPEHLELCSVPPPWEGARLEGPQVDPFCFLLYFEHIFADSTEGIWGEEVPLLPLACGENVRRNVATHVCLYPLTRTIPCVTGEGINPDCSHVPKAEEDDDRLAEVGGETM